MRRTLLTTSLITAAGLATVLVAACGPSSKPPPGGGDGGAACGDGVLTAPENCDDGNARDGDGCSSTCRLEPGYACPAPGQACVKTTAVCGDGIVTAPETCDDENRFNGDGCSDVCQLEAGYACPTPGAPCRPSVCGDGVREGEEGCDDGNTRPFDGCSADCKVEPQCSGGPCVAICGDGIVYPGEECDDGNNLDGDGCSHDCKAENIPGITCQNVTSDLPASITVPVIFRDFKGNDEVGGHPDFEHYNGGLATGLVKDALVGGVPVFKSTDGSLSGTQQLTDAAHFAQWYADVPGVNPTFLSSMTLTKQLNDTYVLDNQALFPLDALSTADPCPVPYTCGFGLYKASGHDFHFTTELRYWFTYQGGENLVFTGDDDVWVFINGHLAVDIGGVHGAKTGSVTLDDVTAAKLGGLVKGQVYEADLFHAERHTSASTFNLTLGKFVKATTHCVSVCGDGLKAPGEQCDDGNLVDGDGCSSTCKFERPL